MARTKQTARKKKVPYEKPPPELNGDALKKWKRARRKKAVRDVKRVCVRKNSTPRVEENARNSSCMSLDEDQSFNEAEQSKADSDASVATEKYGSAKEPVIANEESHDTAPASTATDANTNNEKDSVDNVQNDNINVPEEQLYIKDSRFDHVYRDKTLLDGSYERLFKCPECNQEFEGCFKVNRHLTKDHGPKYQNQCKKCERKYAYAKDLMQHTKTCMGYKKGNNQWHNKCIKCGKTWDGTMKSLREHARDEHNIQRIRAKNMSKWTRPTTPPSLPEKDKGMDGNKEKREASKDQKVKPKGKEKDDTSKRKKSNTPLCTFNEPPSDWSGNRFMRPNSGMPIEPQMGGNRFIRPNSSSMPMGSQMGGNRFIRPSNSGMSMGPEIGGNRFIRPNNGGMTMGPEMGGNRFIRPSNSGMSMGPRMPCGGRSTADGAVMNGSFDDDFTYIPSNH